MAEGLEAVPTQDERLPPGDAGTHRRPDRLERVYMRRARGNLSHGLGIRRAKRDYSGTSWSGTEKEIPTV